VGTDLGASDPGQQVAVTVRFKLPAQAAFDRAVEALYAPGSASFHRWMTADEIASFGAPAAEIAGMRAALTAAGLHVVSVDRFGFSMRAEGTLGAAERAFHTQVDDFVRDGQRYRRAMAPAHLSGAADGWVRAVVGLDSHTVRPLLARAVDRRTGKPFAAVPVDRVAAAGGLGSLITDRIFGAPASFTYTTPGAKLPVATYGGIVYDPDAPLAADFTAAQVQAAYGLPAAYAAGIAGQGQTIVLCEGFGYPTIQADANAFSRLNGLPALTDANFSIVYPEGKPNPLRGAETGWDGEIALDVQWAHAVAPDAKIVVVATRGQDDEAFEASMTYIIERDLGNVVSDSWEEDLDLIAPAAEQISFNDILELAAARGISFQFSSGDGGDEGVGSPIGSAAVPSVEPYATAVGGTAIVNQAGKDGFVSIGWGDVGGFVATPAGPVVQPKLYFVGGGGGGESVFWKKPAWQAALPGVGRQTPDISALSDPYTGVPIVLTYQGVQGVYPGVGGTSLGSPIFSAIWALANQKAGHPLGQAARTIAGMTSGITDVVAMGSGADVTGAVTVRQGTIDYSTQDLFGAFTPGGQVYPAAVTNQPADGGSFVLGFSLDTTLAVGPGWDDATGFGTPDGLAFIDAAAGYR
jgi:subtilase family serine protease